MYRYLYKSQGQLSKFVRKQYKNYKQEEQGYIAAFLSQIRNKIQNNIFEDQKYDQNNIMQEIYPQINLMESYEHWQLANNDHIEQVFNLLDGLKKANLNKEDLILNKRYEELSDITALIDPDKFPIFSLVEVIDSADIVSVWDYKQEILDRAIKNIGFKLQLSQSQLEHHEAGDGVYLEINTESIYAENQAVPAGTLLGLIPGAIFDSLRDFEQYHEKFERENDEYLHRADNTVIDFGTKIFYPSNLANNMTDLKDIMEGRQKQNANDNNSIHQIYGEMINPYALGHKINHPPKDVSPNVIFQDIYLPIHFFSEDYLQYLPNLRVSKIPEINFQRGTSELNFIENKKDFIRTVGVFALRDIKDKEELFINYFEQNMFDVEDQRDWLKRPPPLSPYFTKQEYDNEFTLLARIIDSFLFKKYASLYNKFEESVQHDPDRHLHEQNNKNNLDLNKQQNNNNSNSGKNQDENINNTNQNLNQEKNTYFNDKIQQFNQKKQKQ